MNGGLRNMERIFLNVSPVPSNKHLYIYTAQITGNLRKITELIRSHVLSL